FVERYREAGGRGEVRGVRIVHVASTPEEAKQRVADCAALYWQTMQHGPYHREAVELGLIPGGRPDDLDELLDRSLFIVGDPDHVQQELQAYRASTGVDRVDVMLQLPLLGADAVHDAMSLFMDEVAPGLDGMVLSEDGDVS